MAAFGQTCPFGNEMHVALQQSNGAMMMTIVGVKAIQAGFRETLHKLNYGHKTAVVCCRPDANTTMMLILSACCLCRR